MIPRTDQKLNLLLLFTFYHKYLKIKTIFNLGIFIITVLYLKYNRIKGFVGVQNGKAEQPAEHGQPMEQTRGLFCTCDLGVARCQSQHQCHFWRMSSMFEAYCTGKFNQIFVIHETMNGCKNLKMH